MEGQKLFKVKPELFIPFNQLVINVQVKQHLNKLNKYNYVLQEDQELRLIVYFGQKKWLGLSLILKDNQTLIIKMICNGYMKVHKKELKFYFNSKEYGIDINWTIFETLGMFKNIIPAMASTNAIIAA